MADLEMKWHVITDAYDDLPDDGQEVILYTRTGRRFFDKFRRDEDDENDFYFEAIWIKDVVAWMPWSKPPKDVSKDETSNLIEVSRLVLFLADGEADRSDKVEQIKLMRDDGKISADDALELALEFL